jgi:hypothetical protein
MEVKTMYFQRRELNHCRWFLNPSSFCAKRKGLNFRVKIGSFLAHTYKIETPTIMIGRGVSGITKPVEEFQDRFCLQKLTFFRQSFSLLLLCFFITFFLSFDNVTALQRLALI